MYNYTRWYYENNKTHVFSIYNMGDIAIEFNGTNTFNLVGTEGKGFNLINIDESSATIVGNGKVNFTS